MGEESGYETATLKKYSVKEILVKSKTGLSKHSAQLIKHSSIGEDAPEDILLGILEAFIRGIITNTSKLPPFDEIILLSLVFISKHTIGLIYLLKLFLSLLLIAWISIWVMFEGKFF